MTGPNFELLNALAQTFKRVPEAAQLHATMTAAALAGNPDLALEWGQILTEHTAPPVPERPTPRARIYTLYAKILPGDRGRSGWVMSQATLDEFAGESVSLPAVILGRPVRIDPDAQGITVEPCRNTVWKSPAWMWP